MTDFLEALVFAIIIGLLGIAIGNATTNYSIVKDCEQLKSFRHNGKVFKCEVK